MKHPTENSCTQCAQHSHVCKHWQEETIRLEILIVKQKKNVCNQDVCQSVEAEEPNSSLSIN